MFMFLINFSLSLMDSFSTHILGYVYPYIRFLFLGFCVIQDVDLLIEIYAELQQMSRLRFQSLELNPVLLENYKRSTDSLAEGCIRQRCEK